LPAGFVWLAAGQGFEVREERRGKRPGAILGGGQGRELRSGSVEPARREIQDPFRQSPQGPWRTVPAQRAEEAIEAIEIGAGQALSQDPVCDLLPFREDLRGEGRALFSDPGEEFFVGAPPVEVLELRQGRGLTLLLLLEAPLAHDP